MIDTKIKYEDFKTRVLLNILKLSRGLSDEKYVDTCGPHFYGAWKRFFYDVLRDLESEGLLKAICLKKSEMDRKHLEVEVKEVAPHNKLHTVSSIVQVSRSKYGKNKAVPFIRLSGLWLWDYGFDIGQKFEVIGKKNQLILKLSEPSTTYLNIDEDNL